MCILIWTPSIPTINHKINFFFKLIENKLIKRNKKIKNTIENKAEKYVLNQKYYGELKTNNNKNKLMTYKLDQIKCLRMLRT